MKPGLIALLGSGETSNSGGQIFEMLAEHLDLPLRVALLETPAGFELNAGQVTGRVGDYLRQRLQNFQPQIVSVPARRREMPYSTQHPELLQPAAEANLLFMGPGSPTYAVRQLRDSLAWDIFQAAHRQGAALALASAATISLGSQVLPVYEIFKAGEDPHWRPGLNFFAAYGLDLVIVPHWNNNQGGADVDTSRCFIGRERFDPLLARLQAHTCVLGIDEHTGALLDLENQTCRVIGQGGLHLLSTGKKQRDCSKGTCFHLSEFGPFHSLLDPAAGLTPQAWEMVAAARQPAIVPDAPSLAPLEVVALAEARLAARARKDWSAADTLRRQLAELGWRVVDTPEGQKLELF